MNAALLLLLCGCPDEKPPAALPSRFDAVTTKPLAAEASRFCDKVWPGDGDGARPWQGPALRKLDGAPNAPNGKGWRWVNAWATWCAPCVEEMALLTRWRDTLQRDSVDVSFELLSVDAAEDEAKLKEWLSKSLPGPVSWVKSADDFPSWLEKSVGLSPDSAIPIHFLVDPAGKLRCARVGAVHAQDFGVVRTLLSGGG